MAKLTTKQRKHIPSQDFGLPKQKAYPLIDPAHPNSTSHAADAKARATQAYKRGKLSKQKEMQVDHRADQVIARIHKKQK